MLTHLDGAHPEVVARLTRLVEPRLLLGVVCVAYLMPGLRTAGQPRTRTGSPVR
jgi:hypothetical protein